MGESTVCAAHNFNAVNDAKALRTAMKGAGTDEKVIIKLLTSRSNNQRLAIAKYFEEILKRDLITDLKSELNGNFEKVVVGLVLPPVEYLCRQLHKAIVGTEEHTLIEIICSRNNEEIAEIVKTYEKLYNTPLVEHMCSEIFGNLTQLLTVILNGTREDSCNVNKKDARAKAINIHCEGEEILGTEGSEFCKVLAHQNFAQMNQIFEEYKDVAGKTIQQALKEGQSGDYLDALLAIVECVETPHAFFAKRLYKAMDGAGTDDDTLIRIIVCRSEIDLGSIKQEFESQYGKTLESYLANKTSAEYKKVLLSLISG